MNTENGWSKIRNDIHDDPLLNKDSEYLSVWIYLITHQAYGEYKAMFSGKVITLKEGQLLTSLGEISKKTGVTTSKINRILKMLKSEKRIETQTDMQKTLVTLDFVGDCETESEKGNEKRMKNEWKTIKETENEKEKRSKREKDKEKEINKTIKKDKNIYPLISPLRGKGTSFFFFSLNPFFRFKHFPILLAYQPKKRKIKPLSPLPPFPLRSKSRVACISSHRRCAYHQGRALYIIIPEGCISSTARLYTKHYIS